MQRVPMTARTSISVSSAWMSASQLSGVASQLCAQIVLARVSSSYETGIYAIAIAVVGFLSSLQSIGLQAFIVREKHLTPSVSATAFTVNAAMSSSIASAMVVVGSAGARFSGDPGVGHVLYAMAFVPVIGIAAFQPSASLEREGRFRAIGSIQTAASLSGAIVTITAASTGASFMSAAFGQIAMAVVQAAAMIVIGRTMPPVRFGSERWREVADFAGQMSAISGIS
ncbi:hypothetical protein OY671_008530, partial [Metschnikowia pulcherrima]